ncbi:MAG TPA: hypothetical protein VIT62_14485 [Lysobacter sp.]
MSRARNIKPGFFKNEELAELPFEFRLLFQGLWCLADREGRMEYRPKRIKAEVFAYDNVDVVKGLRELEKHGFIDIYTIEDCEYIQVVAFCKHQNPHHREAESTIPASVEPRAFPGNSGTSRADSLNLIPDSLNPSTGDARPGPASESDLVVSAYHRALPKCQRISVLNDKRKKRISSATKLARRVCQSQGWEYTPEEFWGAYFAECSNDPWMRGEVPNPKNPAWVQNLDVLLAEDRFATVMDKAIAAMRAGE